MAVRIDEFIRIWQHADTLEEVVEKTGLGGVRSASAKASALRRKGVPLKHFRSMSSNVDYLVAVAKEAAAEVDNTRWSPTKETPKPPADHPAWRSEGM